MAFTVLNTGNVLKGLNYIITDQDNSLKPEYLRQHT